MDCERINVSAGDLTAGTAAQQSLELDALHMQGARARALLHKLRLDVIEAKHLAEVAALATPLRPHGLADHAETAPIKGERNKQLQQLRDDNAQLVQAVATAHELQSVAQDAQKQQTEFMAVLAHELRNPLAPIRTAASLLTHVHGDESKLTQLQAVIERQVAHLTRLVGDLLDVSRVKTGKLRLERCRVDMASVIDTAVTTCRPAIDSRKQRMMLRMPPCALELHGDPTRLTQVVVNLLDNASKYTPDGGDIGMTVVLADDHLTMTVSDSGIGITAQAMPNIFEPFVQDEHAVGFNGIGLGIGLTVVRELVEAHGGTVMAKSAGNGLGSEFVVTLPAVLV